MEVLLFVILLALLSAIYGVKEIRWANEMKQKCEETENEPPEV